MSTHLTQFSAQELLEIRFGLQSPNAALRTKALAKVAASIPKDLVDGNVFVEALQNGSVAGSAVDDALQFVRVLIGQRDAHADVELAGHFFNALSRRYNHSAERKPEQKKLEKRIRLLENRLREARTRAELNSDQSMEPNDGDDPDLEVMESDVDDECDRKEEEYAEWKYTLQNHVPVEISLTEDDVANKLFTLYYSVAKNKYWNERTADLSQRYWSQAFKVDGIERARPFLSDDDSNRVYLTRREGEKTAEIGWRVNLAGLEVAEVEIKLAE